MRRSYASTVVIGDCIYALGGFNGELFSDTVINSPNARVPRRASFVESLLVIRSNVCNNETDSAFACVMP